MKNTKRLLSIFVAFALILTCVVPAFAQSNSSPIVDTAYGRVQGMNYDGGECYYGIPYAKATEGELRFQPPQSPEKWDGIFNATAQPKDPIQSTYSALSQSEDSLRLNVWVPDSQNDKPLAVMFWIYGGSYATGGVSASYYDMSTMANETGCIIVSANYRLNVCGFLDLREIIPDATANNGLRDIVFALEWVNENISAFGGDPSNVTVFGQSAGAALANALLCVPSAQNYFNKVISQSACGDAFYSVEQAKEVSEKWISMMGNPDAEELVDMSPAKLVSRNGMLDTYVFLKNGMNCTFNPVIDGEFITCHPSELESTDKKLLVGTTKNEASLFLFFVPVPLTYSSLAMNTAVPGYTEELRKTLTEDFSIITTDALIKLTTERMYQYPMTKLADNLSEKTEVYAYRYDYEPSLVKLTGLGAFHATEIPLLFDSHLVLGSFDFIIFKNEEDITVGKRMRKYWGNFAKFGVPDDNWAKYDGENRQILAIDKTDKLLSDPYGERLALYETYVSPWNR